MTSKLVRVELGPEGNVVRIFRDKTWRLLEEDQVAIMTKAEAVGAIRLQVFERTKSPINGQYECGRCGRFIVYERGSPYSGEMNEVVAKGSAQQGEVSLSNCEALCKDCHQTGPDAAHKDRRWQTSKIKDPNVGF